MAFRRDLSHRLLDLFKLSNRCLKNCRISSSSVLRPATPNSNKTGVPPPDPGDKRFFLFGQEIGSSAFRDNLLGTLKSMGVGGERIRSDSDPVRLTADDVRKVLRAAQLETVKWRLREVGKTWIPHSEFIRICGQGCSDPDGVHRLAKSLDESGTVIIVGNLVVLRPEQFARQSVLFPDGVHRLAKSLDESGTVIIVGNLVVLRPEQVAKVVEDLIPMAEDDPRRRELEEMEKEKGKIDSEAESLVRRELWYGLGFLALQTFACMRLTFWELSWDVMEPICFFLTSLYCMGCYGFFLVTLREPSFVGFFQSRLSSKQTRLIKLHNFDIGRYNHLRRLYHDNQASSNPGHSSMASFLFGSRENI